MGLPPWHTRFGVHVGDAVLGNVGSSDRIAAIGDTANFTSRLEGLNKFYGTSILASGQIAAVCADQFLFWHVDRGLPKGAGEPLEVFELPAVVDGPEEFCATAATTKLARDWSTCFEIYTDRDWERALDSLEGFVREHPDDVVAGIYRDRFARFLRQPPPADWDGIARFDRK